MGAREPRRGSGSLKLNENHGGELEMEEAARMNSFEWETRTGGGGVGRQGTGECA